MHLSFTLQHLTSLTCATNYVTRCLRLFAEGAAYGNYVLWPFVPASIHCGFFALIASVAFLAGFLSKFGPACTRRSDHNLNWVLKATGEKTARRIVPRIRQRVNPVGFALAVWHFRFHAHDDSCSCNSLMTCSLLAVRTKICPFAVSDARVGRIERL